MPSIYAADVQLGKPKKIASDDAYKENVAPTDKPKRTLSDETKQKLKEARERKKQERLDAAKQAEEAEQAERDAAQQAEQAAQAKKEAAAAKRREARLKRKAPAGPTPEPSTKEDSPTSDAPAGEAAAGPAKPKRQRKTKIDLPELSTQEIADTKKAPGDQPPQWFTKFVTTIMTEKKEQEGVKTSKRELKAEGEKAAEQKWADSYTRDRIRNAVDGHLGQMYSMIFR